MLEPTIGKGPVLVVDDDPDIVAVIRRTLAGEGVEILSACSGEQALEVAAVRRPQLVILDVNMPGMDGFEVCTRLRADPATAGASVVFLTGLGDIENRVKGLELGADEYLTKPFQPREIVARVRTLLRVHGLRASLSASLYKVRSFNTFVENVTMGIENFVAPCDALERLIVGQVIGSGPRGAGVAGALAVGRQSGAAAGTVRCTVYAAGAEGPVSAGPLDFPDVIKELPGEVSIGLRFGPLAAGAAAAIASAVGPALSSRIGTLRDAAVFAEGSTYLAAFNFPSGATPFDAELLRGLSLHLSLSGRLCSLAGEAQGAFEYTVGALARAAEALDTDTGNHIIRVNAFAAALAAAMGAPEAFVNDVSLQAQLHDVGKIHVDPAILRKPGRLTPAEWEQMKRHPAFGATIIGGSPRLSIGRSIAESHHERYDGSGYPAGRKGAGIPLEGRIAAVADSYDAIRSERPYKPAQGHETAVRAILEGDDRHRPGGFDPDVVLAFRRVERQIEELFKKMK